MGDKKRILVADDDEDFRMLLYMYLKRKGYEVLTAEDGGQALDIALKEPLDLLLLDLMMPVKDGFQVASELTARMGVSAPRILVITGRNLLEEDVALLLAGVAGAMHKPIKMEELSKEVERLLAMRPEESPLAGLQ